MDVHKLDFISKVDELSATNWKGSNGDSNLMRKARQVDQSSTCVNHLQARRTVVHVPGNSSSSVIQRFHFRLCEFSRTAAGHRAPQMR
jgi:hypothetical protein